MSALGSFLVAIAGPVVKKALVSIGIGIVSYAAMSAAINAALSAAKTAWAGLGGDALGIIQMAGIGTAISILAGALIARAALSAGSKLEIFK
jgi:hypothetical protein